MLVMLRYENSERSNDNFQQSSITNTHFPTELIHADAMSILENRPILYDRRMKVPFCLDVLLLSDLRVS